MMALIAEVDMNGPWLTTEELVAAVRAQPWCPPDWGARLLSSRASVENAHERDSEA